MVQSVLPADSLAADLAYQVRVLVRTPSVRAEGAAESPAWPLLGEEACDPDVEPTIPGVM